MFLWPFRRGFKNATSERIYSHLLGAVVDDEKQFCMPEKDMLRLCRAAKDLLLQEPSLLELPRFEGETVLVGDLHGQFADLQTIFRTVGLPGDNRRYIFLGDYVDRGECGLEIVACLFAMKLRHPNRVFLLRGNHECTEITVMFGFCMECQRRSTLTVWEAVMQVFDSLPLAAVLQRKVLAVHGGISPHLTSLSDINGIKRPVDVNPSGEGLLVDLLWADPSSRTPGWAHSPRGVSYNFGLSAARELMGRTGLRSIVRAHTMQAEGFEVLGNHEVVTVFSAVNYRGSGNTGAVLVLDPDHAMHFRTFLPPEPPPSSPSSVLPIPAGSSTSAGAYAVLGEGQQAQQEAQEGGAVPDSQAAALSAVADGHEQQRQGPGSPQAATGRLVLQQLARVSPEQVAEEEVLEDSLEVHHQLSSLEHDWRYTLPAVQGTAVKQGDLS